MLSSHGIRCPYCGEPVELAVDVSEGGYEAIEDCVVCCRPMAVLVDVDDAGEVTVSVRAEDDA